MMAPPAFEELLKATMGLDAASIGAAAVERAVLERQQACRLPHAQAYWDHVNGSAAELQQLVEAVVVPETWFFRDREAFAALARMALEEWLPAAGPHGVLRLLSLPCASGEEPYSMAMALLDAGLPVQRFRIDAVDISERVLELARRALYGRNSFRGADLAFRERYFEAVGQNHRPLEAVRAQVQFRQGNLLAADFGAGAGNYDAIFCRNVLIYFDQPTQDRAVAVLRRLLAERGMLFVGPAETGLLYAQRFVSAKIPLAFAFRKNDAKAPAAPPPRPQTAARPAAAPAPTRRPGPPAPARAVPARAAAPAAAQARRAPPFEEAARLADQGRLVEAAKLCEDHLALEGPSAKAFHLLGLIRNAAGNLADAAHYFRKALYLEQDYYEAAAHLAFVLEKQGDAAGAQTLRNRLRRLELRQVRT